MVGQQLEGADVLPTTGTFHIYIEDGIVHLAHDAFTTAKYRCVVVQEAEPQVDVHPAGSLVADVAEERATVFTLIGNEMTQNVLLGDADATMGLADVEEQLVEGIVVERMIDETCHGLRMTLKSQARGREPLPVAVMSKDGGTVLSLVKTLLQLLHTPELNVL